MPVCEPVGCGAAKIYQTENAVKPENEVKMDLIGKIEERWDNLGKKIDLIMKHTFDKIEKIWVETEEQRERKGKMESFERKEHEGEGSLKAGGNGKEANSDKKRENFGKIVTRNVWNEEKLTFEIIFIKGKRNDYEIIKEKWNYWQNASWQRDKESFWKTFLQEHWHKSWQLRPKVEDKKIVWAKQGYG